MKTILQMLGLRSDCCSARIATWHHDAFYCTGCLNHIGRQLVAVPITVDQPAADGTAAPRRRTTH